MKTMLKRHFKHIQRWRNEASAQKSGINQEINYLNWWPCNFNERQWFNEFLIHRGVLKPGVPNQITMSSVMGPRYLNNLRKSNPLIFFTAEDTEYRFTNYNDYMIGAADLSLGFKFIDDEPNYQRFPLWMMYSLSPTGKTFHRKGQFWYSPEDFVAKIQLNRRFSTRTIMASLVARHDHRGNGKGLRALALNTLQNIGQVQSAGKFLRNTQDLKERYNNDILSYLQACKFNICFENTNSPGYVTEKIFQSLLSGAIPIYWGSGNNPEPEFLTGNGVIFFDERNPDVMSNKVQQILHDDSFRSNFLSESVIRETAVDRIEGYYDQLEKKVRDLL